MGRKLCSTAGPTIRFTKKRACGTDGRPVVRQRPIDLSAAPKRRARGLGAKTKAQLRSQRFNDKNREHRNATNVLRSRKARAEFTFSSRTYGLTFSRAESIDSPQELHDWLQDRLGVHLCTVCQEAHTDGGKHFHCSGRLDRVLKFTSAAYFDYEGRGGVVSHPNIVLGGKAWEAYVRKGGWFVTNVPERPQVMRDALETGTLTGALNHIMVHDPTTYVRQAVTLEANLLRHYRRTTVRTLPKYAGPYPASRYPPDWNPASHSLHVWGPPGGGKTCFAMHLLREHFGADVEHCKGHVESMKSLSMINPFMFDEVLCLSEPAATSREITDVVSGGTVHARYCPIDIPPGLARVFTSNSQWVFKNPDEAVYNRRVVQWYWPLVAPVEEWRQCEPAPLTPRMVDDPHDIRPPPRPPTPEQPPPPPPGTPPSRGRSPPPPPDTPYPEIDSDGEPIELPDPDNRIMFQRWRDDETLMAPEPAQLPVALSPVFSPGWDFLLPYDSIESNIDPLAEDTLMF